MDEKAVPVLELVTFKKATMGRQVADLKDNNHCTNIVSEEFVRKNIDCLK